MFTIQQPLLPTALLAWSLFVTVASGQAPPAAPPPASPGEDVVFTAPGDMKRALDAAVPDVRFDETPLPQVLNFLQERARINLLVDWADLSDNGVDADRPITIHLRNLPLRVVLAETLRQAGGNDVRIGYVLADGFVRVATEGLLRREARILPEVRFRDAPLPAVIEFLRSADPDARIVLAGEPGASPQDLVISELELRQVTVSQVLQALQAAYPRRLELMRTGEEENVAVWALRVLPGRGIPSELTTAVFRLREAIDHTQKDMQIDDRNKARGAVLQLLEHALRIAASHGEPVAALQLHEATDTLLFRGTTEEMMVVRNALLALSPSSPIDRRPVEPG